jgi:multifunctional beta-oxidation protein
MTATVMPPEMVEALKPDYIAPIVAFLAHESNTSTGGVFEVGSGWAAKVRWQRTGGVGFPVNKRLLPEQIAARFTEIVNFEDGRATYPTNPQESFMAVQANFDNIASESESAVSGPVFEPVAHEYTNRDVILYALGVGAQRTDLHIVYENNDPFITLPTYAVVPAFPAFMSVNFGDLVPNFNPMMLLHGEQYTLFHKPLPTEGKLLSTAHVVDVLDKGKAASVILGVKTKDATTGELYCENQFTLFIRGSGGFGGKKDSERGAATAANNPPKRAPDAIVRESTVDSQAALYRLSGDYNPLHLDPNMAAMGNFEKPILHGLCTFGIAGKHILAKYGDNDPASFKSIKVRFAKHVFPGETVETHMWREGNKVIFQVKVVERNEIAISNAAVELNEPWASKGVSGGAAAAGGGAPAAAPSAGGAKSLAVDGFQASNLLVALEKGLTSQSSDARKSLVSKTKAIFEFNVSNSSGATQNWFVDLKSGEGLIGVGSPASGKSDLVVSVKDADLMDLAAGKLNAQKAFMSGKIKVKGNIALATKLEGVLKLAGPKAKL